MALLPLLIFFLGRWFCDGFYEIDVNFRRSAVTRESQPLETDTYKIDTIEIPVKNDPYESVLHAWLLTSRLNSTYSNLLPIVVMSHGIGGQKDMGLLKYGEEFAQAGYAVLIFDYRHFGGSNTKKDAPMRNFINPWNHYEDIKTVVQYIKSHELQSYGIDSNKIALWGTSFAGGHVLMASSELPAGSISAIISQVPHLNGKEATKQAIASRGLIQSIRVILLGVGDLLFSHVLQVSSPLYVKIASQKELNEIGYMSLTKEHYTEYISKHPKVYLGGWKNLAPARMLLFLSLYNPVQTLKSFSAAPVLFVTAKDDDLCPPRFVSEAIENADVESAKLFSHVQVHTNHFGIYGGAHFDLATKEMKTFLSKHLN